MTKTKIIKSKTYIKINVSKNIQVKYEIRNHEKSSENIKDENIF